MGERGRPRLITFVESPLIKVQLNWRFVILQSEDGMSQYIAYEVRAQLLQLGVPSDNIELRTVEQLPLLQHELDELGELDRQTRLIDVDVRIIEGAEISRKLKERTLFYISADKVIQLRAVNQLDCPVVHPDTFNPALGKVSAILHPEALRWFGTHYDGADFHTVFISNVPAEGVDVRLLHAAMEARVIRVLIYQSSPTVVGIAVIPPVRTVYPGNTSVDVGGVIQGRLDDPDLLARLHKLYPETITWPDNQE